MFICIIIGIDMGLLREIPILDYITNLISARTCMRS
jgi:hypothetical protein